MAGLEKRDSVEFNENGGDLKSLDFQEITKKYSSKVKDKEKAKLYLRDMEGSFKGTDKSNLSKELIRYIGANNKNVSFEDGMSLDSIPEEDAVLYIAYAQDMLNIDVDGIIGDQTLGRLNKIYTARQKEFEKRERDSKWLLTEVIPEIERREGIIPKQEGLVSRVEKGFKMPEMKSLSRDKLREEIKKTNNRAELRRVRKKIPQLIAKYNLQIEGGVSELARRAKAKKAEVEKLQAHMVEFEKGLNKGNLNFEEFLVLIGMNVPEDLK